MKQANTFDSKVRNIVTEIASALNHADKAYGAVTSHIKALLGNDYTEAKTVWKGVLDSKPYKGASERVQATFRQAANRHMKTLKGAPEPKVKGATGANTSGKVKGGKDAAIVINRNNWRAQFWKLLEAAKPVMPEEAYTELGAVLNKFAK